MTATQRFVCYGVLAAIGAASNLGCGGDAKLEKDVPAAVEGIILNLSADVSTLTETSYRQAKESDSIAAYVAFLDGQRELRGISDNLWKLDHALAECTQKDSDAVKNLRAQLDEAAGQVQERKKNSKEQKKEAYGRIFKLVVEIGCLEGYVYFVNTFADAEDVPVEMILQANDYVVNGAFEIAKEQNSVESYGEFLERFPSASNKIRDEAIEKAVTILEDKATQELERFRGEIAEENPGKDAENSLLVEQKREKLAGQMGERLTEKASDSDEEKAKYLIYFKALTERTVFDETEAKQRWVIHDKNNAKLDAILLGQEKLRQNSVQLGSTLKKGLQDLKDRDDDLAEKLQHVMENQSTSIEVTVREIIVEKNLPVLWDKEKDTWENLRILNGEVLSRLFGMLK